MGVSVIVHKQVEVALFLRLLLVEIFQHVDIGKRVLLGLHRFLLRENKNFSCFASLVGILCAEVSILYCIDEVLVLIAQDSCVVGDVVVERLLGEIGHFGEDWSILHAQVVRPCFEG